MLSFLFRRLLATLPVLGVVAVLVFLMLRLTPGDPAAVLAGATVLFGLNTAFTVGTAAAAAAALAGGR